MYLFGPSSQEKVESACIDVLQGKISMTDILWRVWASICQLRTLTKHQSHCLQPDPLGRLMHGGWGRASFQRYFPFRYVCLLTLHSVSKHTYLSEHCTLLQTLNNTRSILLHDSVRYFLKGMCISWWECDFPGESVLRAAGRICGRLCQADCCQCCWWLVNSRLLYIN